MLKVIAWNIARRSEAWRLLADLDAEIGLLQEANAPPADVIAKVTVDPAPWEIGTTQLWRTAIVKLSDRVQVNWLDAKRT